MVFIGPTDLAADLQLEGAAHQDALNQIINDAAKRCAEQEIPIGTITYGGRSVKDLKSAGFQMLVVGSDVGMLREALSSLPKM